MKATIELVIDTPSRDPVSTLETLLDWGRSVAADWLEYYDDHGPVDGVDVIENNKATLGTKVVSIHMKGMQQ